MNSQNDNAQAPLPQKPESAASQSVTSSAHEQREQSAGTSSRTTTVQVPDDLDRIASHQHVVHLTKVHSDAIALLVMGQDQPILVRGKGKLIVGRHVSGEPAPSVDLTPYQATSLGVSRQHAAISRSEKGYNIEDMGSTNGTWLNERRLAPNVPYALRNGDQIRLGQLVLYVYSNAFSSTEQKILLVERDPFTGATSIPNLTPDYLVTTISPYLKALVDLQAFADEALGRGSGKGSITSMNAEMNSAPIAVTLDNVSEAIDFVKNKVKPWKRLHAQELTQYLRAKETAEASGLSGDSPPKSASYKDVNALQADIDHMQTQLALDLISQVAPSSSAEDRKEYFRRLLPIVQVFVVSKLEIGSETE